MGEAHPMQEAARAPGRDPLPCADSRAAWHGRGPCPPLFPTVTIITAAGRAMESRAGADASGHVPGKPPPRLPSSHDGGCLKEKKFLEGSLGERLQ